MSGYTPKVLVPAAIIPSAQTTVYTSPIGGKGTWIDKATAMNYAGAAATFSINLVTLADVPGNNNLVINTKSVASKATDGCPEIVGKFMQPGDFISIIGVATSFSLAINGRELT